MRISQNPKVVSEERKEKKSTFPNENNETTKTSEAFVVDGDLAFGSMGSGSKA